MAGSTTLGLLSSEKPGGYARTTAWLAQSYTCDKCAQSEVRVGEGWPLSAVKLSPLDTDVDTVYHKSTVPFTLKEAGRA